MSSIERSHGSNEFGVFSFSVIKPLVEYSAYIVHFMQNFDQTLEVLPPINTGKRAPMPPVPAMVV